MDGLDQDTQLLKALVEHSGLRPAAIAKRAGVAVTTINRPYNGSATTRLSQRTLEKLRAIFPDFPGWNGVVEALPAHQPAERSDTVAIPMIELAYGMGGTFLDTAEVGETLEQFPLAFVRMFTRAPADQLCFAHGIGDSMAPTINDRDLLLIDRSLDSVRLNDQIWILSAGGIGMVKRVRVEPGGRVILLSDNENVPDYPAAQDELNIIGRVVAVVRNI